MTATSYDVIVAGVKAKVLRGEDAGYRRRTVRREVQNNLLSQSETPALSSRGDQPSLYQNSWAGGSRWWKPLLTPTDLSSYFRANHMDVWTEPGKVIPGNAINGQASTGIADDCVMVAHGAELYAIGETQLTDTGFRDVYKWTPASNAFVRETGYNSGIAIADQPVSGVSDGTLIYVLCQDASTGGRQVSRFDPVGGTELANWFTNTSSVKYGASLVSARQGLIYTGGGSVFLIDSGGGTTQTGIFADGQIESLLMPSGTSTVFRTEETMVSTPEGIYVVKNQLKGGLYQAWVWRIDRDDAGNWIGAPLTPLPLGSIALSIAYHMGSVIVATTPNPLGVINQTGHVEIVLYQYTQGQPGVLGSMLGNRNEVDESPYCMLGAHGPILYIGGHKRLWAYDAVRGGLHQVGEWPTAATLGAYRAMGWGTDDDGDETQVFVGPNLTAYMKRNDVDDAQSVTDFGDDLTYYTLESNYFDGGLPFEEKEITKVTIQRDIGNALSRWYLQVSADDGAFATVLTDNSTNGQTEADVSITGRRFRYKLIYEVDDSSERSALRAVLFTFSSGQMVTEWDLTIDGDELINVDNEVQDEQAFYDNMLTLAATNGSTTLIDNMQEQAQETSTSATAETVKVAAVEIVKTKPGESAVRLLLRSV